LVVVLASEAPIFNHSEPLYIKLTDYSFTSDIDMNTAEDINVEQSELTESVAIPTLVTTMWATPIRNGLSKKESNSPYTTRCRCVSKAPKRFG